jgi:hypothetical protein
MRVRMEWRDPRIEPGEDCDFVSAERINSIWIPDLFISNSKFVGEVKHLTFVNFKIRRFMFCISL